MTDQPDETPKLTRDDLKKMSAVEIQTARKAGQLDHLLNPNRNTIN